MSFLHPGLLFGLAAIAIPIIIHLFNLRRYKKVYFTNVKFLKNIQQQTQAKSKLKHWLILSCRILAISLIVLAFAQPYIPVKDKAISTANKSVSIYVDNSFSMDAINDNGSLLNNAKKIANSILNQYASTDQFQILSNDFEARHQHFVSKEEAQNFIDEITSSSTTKTLSEIYKRQSELFNSQNIIAGQSYVISDFQTGMIDIEKIENDTLLEMQLIPMPIAGAQNVFIDSCWFVSPIRELNKANELWVRIFNNTGKKIENNPIKLTINGKQKALSSYSVEPNSFADIQLSYTPTEVGIQALEVSITDFPVTFDDHFFISYSIDEKISVLSINSDSVNSYLERLFQKDSLFEFVNTFERQIDYASFSHYNLIIVNSLSSISTGLSQELIRYSGNGGTIVVFPSSMNDTVSYSALLNELTFGAGYQSQLSSFTKVDKINLEHSIFSDLFEDKPERINLPIANRYYVISNPVKSSVENLMRLENGNDFLNRYVYKNGNVYLFAAPLHLSFTNLPMHAMFVPIMHKIALYSKQSSSSLYQIVGTNNPIIVKASLQSQDHVFHIRNSLLNVDIIPEHKSLNGKSSILVNNQIKQAGNYELASDINERVDNIAFNYDRRESLLNYVTENELRKKADDLGLTQLNIINVNEHSVQTAIAEINMGKRYWKLCLILALLFLGIEVLLLRFWKT